MKALSLHSIDLAIAMVKTSKSTTSEALYGILVAAASSDEEVSQIQAKNWLQRCKKASEENFLENALGGSHQWKVEHAPIITADENDAVIVDGGTSSNRVQFAMTAKVVKRATLKLKLSSILDCDLTREVLWNRWPLRAL